MPKRLIYINRPLALCPNNVSIWFDMASAEYARQNYPKAKQDYAQAFKA